MGEEPGSKGIWWSKERWEGNPSGIEKMEEKSFKKVWREAVMGEEGRVWIVGEEELATGTMDKW